MSRSSRENVGASMAHYLVGLHGLLKGKLYDIILVYYLQKNIFNKKKDLNIKRLWFLNLWISYFFKMHFLSNPSSWNKITVFDILSNYHFAMFVSLQKCHICRNIFLPIYSFILMFSHLWPGKLWQNITGHYQQSVVCLLDAVFHNFD
jgi:hypothetical protein